MLCQLIIIGPYRRLALIVVAATMLLLPFLGLCKIEHTFTVCTVIIILFIYQLGWLGLLLQWSIPIQWLFCSVISPWSAIVCLCVSHCIFHDSPLPPGYYKRLKWELSSFAAFLYFNQSGPLVPLLCNPYNADLINRTCSTGELDFSNASKVSKHIFPYQTLVSNSPLFYSVLAFSCFHEMNIWLRDHIYKVDQNLNPNHNVNAGRAVTI